MPISAIDGCSEAHWADVMDVLKSAILKAGYDLNLVSHSNEAGLIHKNITINLYDNPIVVCDVSGKNPNVMFELGMRLAFDKPTIIVKDDKTDYSFDTSGIQHLEYPRDLRFSRIVAFQQALTDKITATVRASKEDPNYTPFLKNFGEFVVVKLDKKEVPAQDFVLSELRDIKEQVALLSRRSPFGTELRAISQQEMQKADAKETLRIRSMSRLLQKYGNSTIDELRDLIGPDFAANFPAECKLSDVQEKIDKKSLAMLFERVIAVADHKIG